MKNKDNLKRKRTFETDRLFLTPRTMADMEDIYALDTDPEVTFLDGHEPTEKSIADYREDFKGTVGNDKWRAYSIIAKDTGEFIGSALVYNIIEKKKKVYWGIILGKKFWRQGIGTEVGKIVIRHVFDDLKLNKLCCGAHSGNPVSLRLQEKLGFVREGVRRQEFIIGGEFYDDIIYGMLKSEYEELYG